MNTQISTKFAALVAALMMNSLIAGGIAYLFNGAMHQHTTVMSVAQVGVTTVTGAV
jgi:hypothetical protein